MDKAVRVWDPVDSTGRCYKEALPATTLSMQVQKTGMGSVPSGHSILVAKFLHISAKLRASSIEFKLGIAI